MAIIRFASGVKDNILTQIKNAIDAGPGAGLFKVYTAPMPATPATAITTQTLLGTLTFADPCGTIAANTLTMDPITQDSSADASGTAAWVRCTDSTGAAVVDLDVTATGFGGTCQLNTTNVVILGPILVSSFVITVP
jgi:hypothetical protein